MILAIFLSYVSDVITFLFLSGAKVEAEDVQIDDFNCPFECGMYEKKDKDFGPKLHSLCNSMKESATCKSEFGKKEKTKKQKKKISDVRIVGGEQAKYAMPWMVNKIMKKDIF